MRVYYLISIYFKEFKNRLIPITIFKEMYTKVVLSSFAICNKLNWLFFLKSSPELNRAFYNLFLLNMLLI